MTSNDSNNTDHTVEKLKDNYKNIIKLIGEDPDREGLRRTPERAAKSILYFCHGYDMEVSTAIQNAIFYEKHKEIVVVKDIDFFSMCEHHMVPFYGHVSIGYMPNNRVLGLSKFARLVEIFSRRLQIQERLTTDIVKVISDCLKPLGVAVMIEATHLCMVMRGVQKMDCTTVTTASTGVFEEDSELWNKFMHLMGKK